MSAPECQALHTGAGRGVVVLSRSHTGGWSTIAQLGPWSLLAVALAPARPPQLLLSGAGNQLQHVSCLAAPATATAGVCSFGQAG